jgi:multicomponent Na+:H+ antiporter subunit B
MRSWLAIVLIVVLGALMITAVIQLPKPGSPDAPAQTHVSAYYVEGGKELGGAENLVTAVLLNFRALDTFGEVVVIFAALVAVLAVAAAVPGSDPPGSSQVTSKAESVEVSPLVAFMVRLLAPFIATFAVFVMLKGHVLPGGGFQGGAVLGAMLVLLALFAHRPGPSPAGHQAGLFWLRATGVLAFVLAGLLGLAIAGWMFSMPHDPLAREMMMIALELGIGIGGAAVLIGLFRALADS